MNLMPLHELLPELVAAENRTITSLGHDELPEGQYALLESYCPDPTCDCRRVMLNVVSFETRGQGILASISFGFDRDAEFAGPFLDNLNPQSRHAQALLGLLTPILEYDTEYVARLESHYRQVKQAAADPNHPIQNVIQGTEADSEKGLQRPRRRRKRKKY